jgi:energy-coupling factor transporter ATP-binding protein EcfA2/energy-coupling factor transporter transmembrane protein EcfT
MAGSAPGAPTWSRWDFSDVFQDGRFSGCSVWLELRYGSRVAPAAYLPTQLPIAVAETLFTGLTLHHAFNQRPEVLESLGIVGGVPGKNRGKTMVVLFLLPAFLTLSPALSQAEDDIHEKFAGMDEAVNERLAADAGKPARSPYLDTEAMGDGVWQGVSAASRVACDMAWLAAVFTTTAFPDVLAALKFFRVPTVLVDAAAIAYRYGGALLDEYGRMKTAAWMKGGRRNFPSASQSSGLILSQIILRSYDRTSRIQDAMTARGENSQTPRPPSGGFEDACPNHCDITPADAHEAGPALVCDRVSHVYKGERSLKSVSMTVEKGEVVALCGPNGAGKTTLLKLIAGLAPPCGGEVFHFGRKLDRKGRREAFRRTGILFQDPNDQLFCTHVRADIAYGPANLGLASPEIDRLINTAMELMEVSHLADRPIHRLSHGEMKRVGLAGLIAMRPPLLLLDEPTVSLDPASARHLIDIIRHLNSHHGYTLVIVTHDINLAADIAKRIIILNNGEIMADGPARQIFTDMDLLGSARLEPPILTRLFQQLADAEGHRETIPVTIEEAVRRLRQGPPSGQGKRHEQPRDHHL